MSSLALINEFLGQPPNASSHGYQIDHILEFCHWFMGALFLGWSAFFVFVLIRFRRQRHPVADHHGVRSPISTHLEFSVVLIEAVLLLGFAIPLWAKRVNEFPPTRDATLVNVVAQQFSFNFHLPGPDGQFGRRDISFESNSNAIGLDPNDPAGKDDIATLGELHVPVNRPVIIELSSKDVIHELCGLGHYSMKGTLVVDTPADYQTWLKERAELAGGAQSAPPAGAPKTENKPPAQPENKPAAPAASPSSSG